MEIFSEVYSYYYKVIAKIINESINKSISEEDARGIIKSNAFEESEFYILPKIIKNQWKLFDIENDSNFIKSRIKNKTNTPLTILQKNWIYTMLHDSRIKLFFDYEQIKFLKEKLRGAELLFKKEDYIIFDKYKNGDNFDDRIYIYHFRKILDSIKNKEVIKIYFKSSKGNKIKSDFRPVKLEYSQKNDKFRVYCIKIKQGKLKGMTIINLSAVKNIEESQEEYKKDFNFEKYLEKDKSLEPVVIEISKERNAIERCMLQFACYDKRTEYNKEIGKYISYIEYNKSDEKELLIQILSFGPTIKVLGHKDFLEQIKIKLENQRNYLIKSIDKEK